MVSQPSLLLTLHLQMQRARKNKVFVLCYSASSMPSFHDHFVMSVFVAAKAARRQDYTVTVSCFALDVFALAISAGDNPFWQHCAGAACR